MIHDVHGPGSSTSWYTCLTGRAKQPHGHWLAQRKEWVMAVPTMDGILLTFWRNSIFLKKNKTCNLSSSPKMHRPRRRTDALTVVFFLCSTVFLGECCVFGDAFKDAHREGETVFTKQASCLLTLHCWSTRRCGHCLILASWSCWRSKLLTSLHFPSCLLSSVSPRFTFGDSCKW